MDNDKKTIIDDAAAIGSNHPEKSKHLNDSEETGERQPPMTRKRRCIIATLVTTAILVCILIASIVLFCLWTTRVLVQVQKHRTIGSKEVDEELYQDSVDRLTTYYVKDGATEFWVILDYNRELEIMKAKNNESTTCYVAVSDPSKTLEKNQTETAQATTPGVDLQRNETLPVVRLHPSTRPILEKSILGRRGQQLCQNVDTFWILQPSCSSPSSGSGAAPVSRVRRAVSRVRRAVSRVRRAVYTFWGCEVDWNNCGPVSFEDSLGNRYYRCPWRCGLLTVVY